MTASAPTSDTVAGYRVIRKLGAGSRSDVFLGVGDAEAEGESAVALKVFHPQTPSLGIAREIDILASLASPHVVGLLDVASGPDGRPVAVLARIPGSSLAHMLTIRGGSLTVGEAITVLVPMAEVVAEMEVAGILHGNISAASIRFGAAGEPILLSFGHAVRVVQPSAEAAQLTANANANANATATAADNDRDRLAAVTCLVFSYLAVQEVRVLELRDWIVALPRPLQPGFAFRLRDRLFDLGEALPIDFEERRRPDDSAWPALARSETVTGANGPALNGKQPRRRVLGWISAHRVRSEAWGESFLGPSPWAGSFGRLKSALRAVRPRFWILGVTSAVLLGATVLPLLWAGESSSTTLTATETNSQAVPAAGTVPPVDPLVGTLPDDPVLAFPALLAERARCIDDLSIVCLEGVDQQGSGALASDRALIGDIQAHGEVGDMGESAANTETRRRAAWAARTAEGCHLVERRGDSALVTCGANSKPASALMIRSEAGWRVRELLDEE